MNHQKQFQIELAVSLIKSTFAKAYEKDDIGDLVLCAFAIAEDTADRIADMIGPCDACDEAAAQAEAEAAKKEIEEMIATLKARLG